MIDYQIFYLDGMKTNEAVTENEDGSYTIFVNENLCEKKRLLAVQRALKHIQGNDFGRSDIQEIENGAHECATAQPAE